MKRKPHKRQSFDDLPKNCCEKRGCLMCRIDDVTEALSELMESVQKSTKDVPGPVAQAMGKAERVLGTNWLDVVQR